MNGGKIFIVDRRRFIIFCATRRTWLTPQKFIRWRETMVRISLESCATFQLLSTSKARQHRIFLLRVYEILLETFISFNKFTHFAQVSKTFFRDYSIFRNHMRHLTNHRVESDHALSPPTRAAKFSFEISYSKKKVQRLAQMGGICRQLTEHGVLFFASAALHCCLIVAIAVVHK